LLDKAHASQLLKMVLARLLEDHLQEEQLADTALVLIGAEPADAEGFLTQLSKQSPHHEVQGIALYALVAQHADALGQANKIEQNKLLALIRRITSQYADVRLNDKTLGELMDPLLFEIEHLAVGKKAPDIKGNEVNGRPLKLSDFRGRVVVVDFFDDDPDISRELYAHHQAVVQFYHPDAFVMLEVSLAPLPQTRTAVDLQKITWPCIADGPGGPISTRWNIREVPRNFVLDASGIIRYRNLYGDDLIQAIEVLLREINPQRAARQAEFRAKAPPKKSSRSRSSRSTRPKS